MKLKWTIHDLNKLQNKGLSFDEQISVDEITEVDKEIRSVSPVQVTGRADFGASKVTFHINIKGTMILPCSRTLADVKFPFDIQSSETFVLSSYGNYEDEDLHQPDGEIVDLTRYIRELILLEVPLQVFSEKEDVKGPAPQSGEGWEVITEEEKKDQIDPRLAKLKELFNEE